MSVNRGRRHRLAVWVRWKYVRRAMREGRKVNACCRVGSPMFSTMERYWWMEHRHMRRKERR